jgi:hypothetical protein
MAEQTELPHAALDTLILKTYPGLRATATASHGGSRTGRGDVPTSGRFRPERRWRFRSVPVEREVDSDLALIACVSDDGFRRARSFVTGSSILRSSANTGYFAHIASLYPKCSRGGSS